MEQITDDQFTALYRWAERERALDRMERYGDLEAHDAEVMRHFNLTRLRREAATAHDRRT